MRLEVKINVDDREKTSGILNYLFAIGGVSPHKLRLELGDYHCPGSDN